MKLKHILCLLLSLLLLSGCLRPADEPPGGTVGEEEETKSGNTVRRPDESVGIPDFPRPFGPGSETKTDPDEPAGAEPAGNETEEHADPDPTGAQENAGHSVNGVRWSVVNGVYRYEFPPRDESRRATVGEMYSFSRDLFSDQPDDWWNGSVSYDVSTGTATFGADRADDVFDAFRKYHAIYRGDTTRKVVYLTFDCGYENGYTGTILDTLRDKGVPAAFFVNGRFVETSADMLRRMIDEGHIVGNHSKNHEMLPTVSVETFLAEVDGLEEMYRAAIPDGPPMLYFRPPSGNCNPWVLKFAEKLGYTTVLYSWAYYDYVDDDQPTWDHAMEKVRQRLHPGCVYLFHATSSTTAGVLGSVIDWIRGQGFEFLPICDIET